MPIVTFTQKDTLRGTLVNPAWYRAKIDSVGEKPSSDGQSTNYPVSATILFDGDTGDTRFKGVPLDWNFNSKAMGIAIPFVEAVTGDKPEPDKRVELAAAVGEEIDIYVNHKTYEGRLLNDVKSFRKARPDVKAVS